MGRKAEGIEAFRELVAQSKNDFEVLFFVANSVTVLREYDFALELL